MQLPFNLAIGAEVRRLSKLIEYQLSAVKIFYSVILIEYEPNVNFWSKGILRKNLVLVLVILLTDCNFKMPKHFVAITFKFNSVIL